MMCEEEGIHVVEKEGLYSMCRRGGRNINR